MDFARLNFFFWLDRFWRKVWILKFFCYYNFGFKCKVERIFVLDIQLNYSIELNIFPFFLLILLYSLFCAANANLFVNNRKSFFYKILLLLNLMCRFVYLSVQYANVCKLGLQFCDSSWRFSRPIIIWFVFFWLFTIKNSFSVIIYEMSTGELERKCVLENQCKTIYSFSNEMFYWQITRKMKRIVFLRENSIFVKTVNLLNQTASRHTKHHHCQSMFTLIFSIGKKHTISSSYVLNDSYVKWKILFLRDNKFFMTRISLRVFFWNFVSHRLKTWLII